MANQISNAIDNAWRGNVSDPAHAPGIRATDILARDHPRRGAQAETHGARAETPADTWIDELQWLAGFPGNWGERRGGWFCGF
jgi:hypothetical protein